MRNLLLDFGGPVMMLPHEFRAQAAAKLGVSEAEFPGGPLDPTDELWQMCERGEITQRDYYAGLAERFGLDVRGFMRAMFEPSGDHLIRPEIRPLVDEVQASGARAGLLSNDLAAFMGEQWQEPITVLKVLDPVVDLSYATHLKPDPRAFAVAIEAMGVEAETIVFVDDAVENVDGARAVGMIGVVFDTLDPADSLERVRAALIDR